MNSTTIATCLYPNLYEYNHSDYGIYWIFVRNWPCSWGNVYGTCLRVTESSPDSYEYPYSNPPLCRQGLGTVILNV
eukprot:scaffold315736_cov19-Prasinocladus_malaysianus.AAC.1